MARKYLQKHQQRNHLSTEQLKFWQQSGFIKISDFFSEEQKRELIAWGEDMESRPETPGKWMKYFEVPLADPAGRQLCRVENFLQYHQGFDNLLRGAKILAMLSMLMGEPAVLF